eukprot:6326691-Prorocentrum_lima.AAC.1
MGTVFRTTPRWRDDSHDEGQRHQPGWTPQAIGLPAACAPLALPPRDALARPPPSPSQTTDRATPPSGTAERMGADTCARCQQALRRCRRAHRRLATPARP